MLGRKLLYKVEYHLTLHWGLEKPRCQELLRQGSMFARCSCVDAPTQLSIMNLVLIVAVTLYESTIWGGGGGGGGGQDYGPFFGVPIIIRPIFGTQQRTIILTTSHMSYGLNSEYPLS